MWVGNVIWIGSKIKHTKNWFQGQEAERKNSNDFFDLFFHSQKLLI